MITAQNVLSLFDIFLFIVHPPVLSDNPVLSESNPGYSASSRKRGYWLGCGECRFGLEIAF